MKQRLSDVLAVEFICPTSIEVGDVVVIASSGTVAAISGAGQTTKVGTVCAHTDAAAYCTVETRYRERRDDRLSGAAIAVGPFVWNAAGKAIAYDSNTHDPSAIAGLAITSASAGDVVIETLEL